MLDVVAHRGAWNSDLHQNSIEAIIHAIDCGCSVEIDLRMNEKHSKIAVSHDVLPAYPLLLEDLIDQIKGKSGTLFLHVKEEPEQIRFFFDEKNRLKNFKCVFFGITNSPIMQKYGLTFGWDHVAYEIEKGNFGTVDGALRSNCEYVWLSEMKDEFVDGEYMALGNAGKKIYQVAPDITCFPSPHNVSGFLQKIKYLHGVCTDTSKFYLDFKRRKPLN